MPKRHHPTWSEIRARYLSEPEVQAAAEELHRILEELPKYVIVFSGHGDEQEAP